MATADESPAYVVDLYRRVIAHADETIAGLPLDAPGHVPWWNPTTTTLYRLLIHTTAETARHAGHLDILRETIDGTRGTQLTIPNIPDRDEAWWAAYAARLRRVAEQSESS